VLDVRELLQKVNDDDDDLVTTVKISDKATGAKRNQATS